MRDRRSFVLFLLLLFDGITALEPTNPGVQPVQTAGDCYAYDASGLILEAKNDFVGQYRVVVQPAVGGVYVALESLAFFASCSDGTYTFAAMGVSWAGANDQIGVAAGQYQFVGNPPAGYQSGWGSLCSGPGCGAVDWDGAASAWKPRVWLFGSSPCAVFEVLVHATACTDCSSGGACNTAISRGANTSQVVGAWFTKFSFTDCDACAANVSNFCGVPRNPLCTAGFDQSAACDYVADATLCNRPPSDMACPAASCDPLTLTCSYVDQGAPACPAAAPQPRVFCSACLASECAAQVGYDTLSVPPSDAATDTIVYVVGPSDQVVGNASAAAVADWGQPTVLVPHALVPVAATLQFNAAELPLTWTLAGTAVTVDAATPQCLNACDAAAGQITAQAALSADGLQRVFTYRVDSTANAACSSSVDVDFVLDVYGCAPVGWSVTDWSGTVDCLDNAAGRVQGVVTSPSALLSDDVLSAASNASACLLDKTVAPLLLPVRASCPRYLVAVSFAAACPVGRTRVGVVKLPPCQLPACAAAPCRVTTVLGPANACLSPPPCNAASQLLNRSACLCAPCPPPVCDGVVEQPAGCACAPCAATSAPCPPNQQRPYPCGDCAPCPSPGCGVGSVLAPATSNDTCDTCAPCTPVNCTAADQRWNDTSQCFCETCPPCGPDQLPVDGVSSCSGCVDCPPPPACPANTSYQPLVDRCACTPCVQVCGPDERGTADLCSPCTPCPPPDCPPGQQPDPASPCLPCVDCPDPLCASPFRYDAACNDTVGVNCCPCTPCTPPNCTGVKNATTPLDPCADACTPCPDCRTAAYLAYVDAADLCLGCYDCTADCRAADSLMPDPADPCRCVNCTHAMCACQTAPVQPADCNATTEFYDTTTCACQPCAAADCACVCRAVDSLKVVAAALPACQCANCTNPMCVCEDAAEQPADCDPLNAVYNTSACRCQVCTPPPCSPGTHRPAELGACQPCTPCNASSCPPGTRANVSDPCNCVACANCTSPFAQPVDAADLCLGCQPCTPPLSCPPGYHLDVAVSTCQCSACPPPPVCAPVGQYLDLAALPCPTCAACQPNCSYPYAANASDACAPCVHCPPPVCGPGTRPDPDLVCDCRSCAVTCAANTSKQQPPSADPLCDPCLPCTQQCPPGQRPVDAADLCSGCAACPPPNCTAGQQLAADLCSCVACPPPACPPSFRVDDSGCHCRPCNDTRCRPGRVVDPADTCHCRSGPPGPNITRPNCTAVDACGVCQGSNATCLGCNGVVGGPRWVDRCGVLCGSGTTCPGCLGTLCQICATYTDLCGVCGGNSSTCDGCDGVPASGRIVDVCGVCGGNGKSCLGCDGMPNTSACATPASQVAAVAAIAGLLLLAVTTMTAVVVKFHTAPDRFFRSWDNEIDDYIHELTADQNPIFQQDVRQPDDPGMRRLEALLESLRGLPGSI